MQARHLLSAAALSLAVAACQPAQQEPAKPRPPVILIEADAPPRPMKPELPPLFDDIERRTFQFDWEYSGLSLKLIGFGMVQPEKKGRIGE